MNYTVSTFVFVWLMVAHHDRRGNISAQKCSLHRLLLALTCSALTKPFAFSFLLHVAMTPDCVGVYTLARSCLWISKTVESCCPLNTCGPLHWWHLVSWLHFLLIRYTAPWGKRLNSNCDRQNVKNMIQEITLYIFFL